MKRISILLATILLSFQIFMISAAAADFEHASAVYENDVVECFHIAKAALGEYYDACYLLTDANLEKYVVNDALVEYLNAKIALSEHRHIRSGVTYEYSENTFELISWNAYDDAIYLFVATDISQKYTGVERLTGIGEGTDLVFQRVNGELKITEWYSEDILDGASRKESVDIEQTLENRVKATKANNALIKSNVNINVIEPIDITSATFSYLDECMVKQNIFFDERDRQKANAANAEQTSEPKTESDNETVVDVETEANQTITRASTLRPLDRFAMTDYAVRTVHYCNSNPSRGSTYVDGYVDFANQAGAEGDCTNFISHCLLAGGAVTRVPSSSSEQLLNNQTRNNYWFFKSMDRRSPTWAGVNQLYDFLTWNTVRGPAGHEVPWHFTNRVEMDYTIGDIIQVKYNGASNYGHSTIITGMDGGISGPMHVYISSRTSSSGCNIDADIETTSYISHTLRLIVLDGYYV